MDDRNVSCGVCVYIFLIYKHDIHVASALFTSIVFADDTTLLFSIKPIGNINCDMMNTELDKICVHFKFRTY